VDRGLKGRKFKLPDCSGLTIGVFIGVASAIGRVARAIGAVITGQFGQGTLAFMGGILAFRARLILAARPGLGLPA
jgi:hypothetical protein